MKKLISNTVLLMIYLLNIFLFSCGTFESDNKFESVLNEGVAIVENGRGVNDTIPFNCIGCKENLSVKLFEAVKNESSKIAKNNLKNPLSFKPVSMDIIIVKDDSLYSFEKNEKIDSVLTVSTNYKYIGQNVYGTEISGEQLITFYVVGGMIKDISGIIKLKDLSFKEKLINRSLYLTYNGEFIEIIPTSDKDFIVKSSISCIDEGAWLLVKLVNGEEVKLISWNDYNCNGTSYFNMFSRQQIEKLKSNAIESVYIVDDKSVGCIVPKNESDYFIQLLKLYNLN